MHEKFYDRAAILTYACYANMVGSLTMVVGGDGVGSGGRRKMFQKK